MLKVVVKPYVLYQTLFKPVYKIQFHFIETGGFSVTVRLRYGQMVWEMWCERVI